MEMYEKWTRIGVPTEDSVASTGKNEKVLVLNDLEKEVQPSSETAPYPLFGIRSFNRPAGPCDLDNLQRL